MMNQVAQENIHLNEITAALADNLIIYHTAKAVLDTQSKVVSDIKMSILDGVTKLGEPYADEYGSAKIITPSPSIRAKGKPINDLVEVWVQSDDPAMKACGQMLLPHLSTSTGKPYIKISKEKK